ncbi:hypothetical protein Q7P37_003690 [Cladosporium fusiforme]
MLERYAAWHRTPFLENPWKLAKALPPAYTTPLTIFTPNTFRKPAPRPPALWRSRNSIADLEFDFRQYAPALGEMAQVSVARRLGRSEGSINGVSVV